jgi:hypothetical protein
MRTKFSSIVVLTPTLVMAAVLSNCSTIAEPSAIPEPLGLGGHVVTSLGIHNSLYAGTDGDGVFRRDITGPHASWVPLGLEGKIIRAVYRHYCDSLGFVTTVGLERDLSHPDSALIYRSEMDPPHWVASDSGMTRTDVTAVRSFDGFPDPATCGETFAACTSSAGQVWRRNFRSGLWEMVLDMGLGIGNTVRVDRLAGNVWAGGETTVLAPWIGRSTDVGETWQVAYPDLGGDNACNSIAISPDDPDLAYAGMEGPVIRTEDGGVTWDYTGLRETGAYIYGLALDSAAPSHILAGGTIAAPNNWALWESFDGGELWAEIPPPVFGDSRILSGISSILADPARAGTFYIATFGDGVWKYQNQATSVDGIPFSGVVSQLVLEQNYPNPFNPVTTLRFHIPLLFSDSPVQLAIYGVRGDLVRVLTNHQLSAGSHRVTWNGRDASGRPVSSGIYYCTLRVGSHQRTCKLNLTK